MSRNPYVQVGLTYVRHGLSSARTAFLIVNGLLVIVCAFGVLASEQPEFVAIMAGSLFYAIVFHMKEQFVDSRSHLMPGFCRPHIVVAAMATSALAVLLPAMCMLAAGSRSLGLMSIMMLLFGVILWSELLGSVWLRFCMGFLYLPFFVEPCRTLVHQLVSGEFEDQAIALLVAGSIMSLLGGFRLVHLNEDMPAYRRRTARGWASDDKLGEQVDADESALFPGLKNWGNDKRSVCLIEHARRANSSLLSRICRWQAAMVSGWSVLSWCLGVLLFLSFMVWFDSQRHAERTVRELADPTGLFLAMTFLPGGTLMLALSKQSCAISHEVLMPVRRTTYVLQLGTACLLSQLRLWAAIGVGMILLWLIATGQPPLFVVIANLVMISGLLQVFFFGVVVWLAPCGSLLLAAVVASGAISVPLVLVSLSDWSLPQWRSSILFAAAFFAAVGLAFACDAYRRWLVADFD